MIIALLAVAALAVAIPALAVWIASVTSRREETARILADRHPGYSDAMALRLWSATTGGDSTHDRGRLSSRRHQHS